MQDRAIRYLLCRRFHRLIGHWPDLDAPRSFSEYILRRIIHDRDPRLKILCDKVALRSYIATALGPEFVVPLLGVWDNADAIDWTRLPERFVLKPSHFSGPVQLVRGPYDGHKLARWAKRWLAQDYFHRSLEWGYLGAPRRILAEPLLIGPDGGPALEVQVQVVAGQTVLIGLVTGERGTPDRYGDWFYPDGTRPANRARQPLRHGPLPQGILRDVVPLAQKVATGFSQLRVDFYLTDQGPRIGELTPYDSGGHRRFDPPGLDFELGALWSRLDGAFPDRPAQSLAP